MPSEPLRLCPSCHTHKSPQDFPTDRPDGSRRRTCLSCQAAAYRERYHRDDRRRALQIAYSLNGTVLRRDPQATALDPGRLAALILNALECRYCGLRNHSAGRGFQVDHMIPLSRGGAHTWDNLALSCARCNRAKWDSTEEEFCLWLQSVARRFQDRPGLGAISEIIEPKSRTE